MCFLSLDKEKWLTVPDISPEDYDKAVAALEGADAELDAIEHPDTEDNAPVALLTLITL